MVGVSVGFGVKSRVGNAVGLPPVVGVGVGEAGRALIDLEVIHRTGYDLLQN